MGPLRCQEYAPDTRRRDISSTSYHASGRGIAPTSRATKKAALSAYMDAQSLVPKIAATSPTPRPPGRTARHYSYELLYASREGAARRDFVVDHFLSAKIHASSATRPGKATVHYRVAAIVIRNTDIVYEERGAMRRDQRRLSQHELAAYKRAWRFASDAVGAYSEGRVSVDTTWIVLDDQVVLKGLTDRLWRGSVRQRHLDPNKLDPPQDDLFARLVTEYDCIVFVWPRGTAGAAFGGGTIRLPARGSTLPTRGGVRSISTSAATSLHELLHTVEERVLSARVHGPRRDASRVFREQGIRDELDWYAHLIRTVTDWRKAKYLTPR